MKDYKSTIDDIQQNIAEIERKNHEAAKKHMRDGRRMGWVLNTSSPGALPHL